MGPLGRRRLRLGCAVAGLAGLLAWTLVRCSPGAVVGDGLGVGQGRAGTTFTIDGSTSRPISPGTSAPMNLVITNTNIYPLALTELRVSIDAVVAPFATTDRPCGREDFAISQSPIVLGAAVAAQAESSLLELGIPRDAWPRVGMIETNVNQDGCKGALLDLSFHVTGTRLGP